MNFRADSIDNVLRRNDALKGQLVDKRNGYKASSMRNEWFVVSVSHIHNSLADLIIDTHISLQILQSITA